MGPLYRRSLARQGFGREIDLVLGANSPRSTATVPPEAEVLLEELTVFGTPAQARERLAQWHAAGAGMPLVFIPPVRPDARIATGRMNHWRTAWGWARRR